MHGKADAEYDSDDPHQRVDFLKSAAKGFQQTVAGKAKTEAAGNGIGQRHHNDGKKCRNAVRVIIKIDVFDVA